MDKLTAEQAKQLLDTLRYFYAFVIFKDDPQSRFDLNVMFDQLDNLLLDYKPDLSSGERGSQVERRTSEKSDEPKNPSYRTPLTK